MTKSKKMRPFSTKWAYVWEALESALNSAAKASGEAGSLDAARELLGDAIYHSRRYCMSPRNAGSLGNTVASMIEVARAKRAPSLMVGAIEATMQVVEREASRAASNSEVRNGLALSERGVSEAIEVPFRESVRRYKVLLKAVFAIMKK